MNAQETRLQNVIHRWPGGGEGGVPLAAFLGVFVFCCSHQTGWFATRTWRWWMGNGRSRAQSVFAEEK